MNIATDKKGERLNAEALAASNRIAEAIEEMRDMLRAANLRAANAESLFRLERRRNERLASALREHRCVPTVEAEVKP